VGDLGVYIHVPFCERICPYCDFATAVARPLEPEREERYLAALLRELSLRAGEFRGSRLETLYFGGGTPSLLQPGSIRRLIEAVLDAFPPASSEAGVDEITLELNPSTVERSRLPEFREVGINRLSVGIQSFNDDLLKRLGRAHRAEEARCTLRACRAAGFDNLSLDLIFGVPGQSVAEWDAELAEALGFDPEHLSIYGLTIEGGTPYERGVERGILRLPEEDASAAMYERAGERLEAAGLRQYELSNFARPGFESRHNRRYWERKLVLGLGVGACSFRGAGPGSPGPFGGRLANPRGLDHYLEAAEDGSIADGGALEVLSEEEARLEMVFLSLRRREGLDARAFAEEFGAAPRKFFDAAIERFCAAGLLEEDFRGDLQLTARGRLLSDEVFGAFA